MRYSVLLTAQLSCACNAAVACKASKGSSCVAGKRVVGCSRVSLHSAFAQRMPELLVPVRSEEGERWHEAVFQSSA